MLIKSVFSLVALCAVASFGVVACSAETDDAPAAPPSEVQDEELRKSLTACSVSSDCVAVDRGGCCHNGWMEAVNKHHTVAYANATKCTMNPRPFCPQYLVLDKRVPRCDSATHQCKMVEVDAAALEGGWGASGANLTVAGGQGQIEFGCASASIDAFTFSAPTTFTATGTQTSGTGVQMPPGMGPTPQAATYEGTIAGNKLTLKMKVGANTSTMTFTKNVHTNLMHCL